MHGFTQQLSTGELCNVALGGAIGAFVKDLIIDGAIELPYKKNGKIFLGFVGGALIGAFVGLALDGNFISALLAGYTGTSLISNLVNTSTSRSRSRNVSEKTETPEVNKQVVP